jgi:anti-anti-sigma regulatory factor
VLPDGESLTWSETVYRLHGFEPGDVVPSTALMLAHCHRDDRAHLETVLRSPLPLDRGQSVRYRLRDTTGTERTVLVVLTPPTLQDAGTGAVGLLVDLGAEIGATASRRADDMLAAAIASREVIDQAKGAVMLAYGLDGRAAFDLLRWHSEHLNVKVRTLAERLLAALPARVDGSDPRQVLDDALASLAAAAASGQADAAAVATEHETAPEPDQEPPFAAGRYRDAAATPARLTVEHAAEGRTVLVRVTGVVDGATAPELVAGLADALRATPARGLLVVDGSGLDRLGPVAALHLTRLRRRAEHAGVQVRMIAPEERDGMRAAAGRRTM